MTAKRWIVREPEPENAARLANILGISPILADLLIARGYSDEFSARAFLTPHYEKLHDPYLMHGMKDKHLKLHLAGPQNHPLEAVWWSSSDNAGQTPDIGSSIEVAQTIELNIWNDEARIQLNVVDLRS